MEGISNGTEATTFCLLQEDRVFPIYATSVHKKGYFCSYLEQTSHFLLLGPSWFLRKKKLSLTFIKKEIKNILTV